MLTLIKSIMTMNSGYDMGLNISKKNLIFGQICFTGFLFCTALLNNAMGTTLWGLSVDSGYSNYNYKNQMPVIDVAPGDEDMVCQIPYKFDAIFSVGNMSNDVNLTTTYSSQGSEYCYSFTDSRTNATAYYRSPTNYGSCISCSAPGGTYTYTGCIPNIVLQLQVMAGSVKKTWDYNCPVGDYCVEAYNACNMQPPAVSGYEIDKGQSSNVFKLECQGDQAKKVTLQITGKLSMLSEAEIQNTDFLINDQHPIAIYSESVGYDSSSHIYNWNGQVRWDVHIPENKRCGDKVTVTPSLAHGYGELNPDEIRAVYEDVTTCNLSSVSISPDTVRPTNTGDDSFTKATIGIALTNPAPSSGCVVNLRIEPVEGTGGHNHVGNRSTHTGTVDQDSVVFVPGEMILYNAAVYTSGVVAGTEKIIAEVNGSVSSTQSVSIDVKVPGLEVFSSPTPCYQLTGTTSNHSANHYGLASIVTAIGYVADQYYIETGTLLGINDMSLIWGGLFDINGNWSTPHSSHRKGTSVDIDRHANMNGSYIVVDRQRLERIAREFGGRRVIEPTIHYEFE